MSNSLTISENNQTLTTSETLVNVLMVSASTVAGGAVTSVNGLDGVVVLDADDIAETATRVYLTPAQKTNLDNQSGTNTGDQDLSGKQDLLVSATNIKSINGSSVLGAGDLVVGGGGSTFLDTEFDITDSVSGYKLTVNTTALTANREITAPNFPFNFNSYFDSSGNNLYFQNNVKLYNSVSSVLDISADNGVPYFRFQHNNRFQLGHITSICWGSGNAATTLDTKLFRKAAGIVGFNGSIDLSNAGTYADNAAAASGGVAVGSVYIETTTNNLKIRV